jgi:signal transduction histidine kinase
MKSESMSPLQRVLVIVAAAILLPATLVVGLVFQQISMGELRDVERQAREAADLIVILSDAQANADLTALRVLSQSRYFADRDIEAGAARARDTIDFVPGWSAVTLSDIQTGEVFFLATRTGITLADVGLHSSVEVLSEGGFGGIERDGPLCPCVYLQVPVPSVPSFVLTAVVTPVSYQEMLLERLPNGAVAALVDRKGNFVARSVDYDERVGTPATQFVRDAVTEGGRGIYQGTTYEGLANYTAYTTSALTGWSAHVAINNTLFDGPRSKANAALIMGAIVAILIGAALFVYTLRDIAARSLEDKRALELQKADALRQFTMTVVHDFRNISTAVQSGLNLMVRETKEPTTVKYAQMIGEVMERGLRLTNRLLSFVREGTGTVEDINVAELLAGMKYLLEQAAGQRIKVQIELPQIPVTVRGYRDQLELALVNLVVNSRDAMNGVGLIHVRAEVSEAEVKVSVADTGPGIPLEMRSQVLRPFFTTKPDGSGTGLGLAQVSSMIQEAGGEIDVGTADEGGALITLHLKR